MPIEAELKRVEAPRAGRIAWGICLALTIVIAIAHFAFLRHHFAPAITTPDANGYFAQATRIAQDHRTGFELESPLQYVGMHWLTPDNQRFFSRYPPGYPTILAVAFKFGGPAAAMMVPVIMASLCLLGLYLLCALWIGPAWALLAVALMAVNPHANEHALYQFAHTPVAFFLVWGLYFLARWERRASWRSALAAGLCFGIVPSVRYPAALYAAAAFVFIGLMLLKERRRWKTALVGVAAAAVPLALLAIRNQLAFGAFWKTGYALTNEQTGFGWNYFAQSWLNYILNLHADGAGFLFALGLAGTVAMIFRRETWHRGVLMVLLLVPVTMLYMAYYWGGGRSEAGLRFLIPTFFLYAIAGVWLLSHVGRINRVAVAAAAVVLVMFNGLWGVPESLRRLERLKQEGAALAALTKELEEKIEPGSLVIASQGIQQHLDFVGGWKLADEGMLTGTGRGAGAFMRRRDVDPNAPNPMQREKMEARARLYENLFGMDRLEAVVEDLWKWAGKDRKIYWVGNEEQIRDFESRLGATWPDRLTVVATIKLPDPPADRPPDFAGRGGRGGFPGPRAPGIPGGAARPDGPDGPGDPPAIGGPPAQGPAGQRDQVARVRGNRMIGDARPRAGRGGGMMAGIRELARGGTVVIVEWTADGTVH